MVWVEKRENVEHELVGLESGQDVGKRANFADELVHLGTISASSNSKMVGSNGEHEKVKGVGVKLVDKKIEQVENVKRELEGKPPAGH